MSRRRLPFFYQQVAGGAVATILAALAALTPLHLNESLVVTANIIMLLAGVGFMGALQDALSGFYLTAGARLTEALLATAGIIAGVSGGLTFADVIGVNIGGLDLGLGDSLKSVSVMALGAAITAGAFAFSSYAPAPDHPSDRAHRRRGHDHLAVVDDRRLRQHLADRASRRSWSVWSATRSPAGCGCRPWWSWSPRSCRCCPVSRSTAGCPCSPRAARYVSLGLLSLITAASVALSLSAGVILGEYVAQPLKREASRLESRLAGPRLSVRCGTEPIEPGAVGRTVEGSGPGGHSSPDPLRRTPPSPLHHVVGVVERDPVLGELVLVVDPHPPGRPADDVEVEVDRAQHRRRPTPAGWSCRRTPRPGRRWRGTSPATSARRRRPRVRTSPASTGANHSTPGLVNRVPRGHAAPVAVLVAAEVRRPELPVRPVAPLRHHDPDRGAGGARHPAVLPVPRRLTRR